MGEEREDTHWK